METVIKLKLLRYLLTHGLISKEQHGSLSRRSTGTQLLDSMSDWFCAVRDKKCVDIVYLDFQKAFDSVSHAKLVQKLEGYGLKGNLLKWIAAFLNGRKQRVVIGDSFSPYYDVISGVPQGIVLGPLLFLLYVNDIVQCADGDVKMRLFADDVKLYVSFYKDDVREISMLCGSLGNILDWSRTWQLQLAIPKCFIAYVGRANLNPHLPCRLGDQILESQTTVRDLGILVSSNLLFSEHCSSIAAKAFSRMCMIFRCFSVFDKDILLKAYKTYVRHCLRIIHSSVILSSLKTCLLLKKYNVLSLDDCLLCAV